MHVAPVSIEGPLLLETVQHDDARGSFVETYRADRFEAIVGPVIFVQDNESHSFAAGTLRGLHFQRPPKAQGKLVRCSRGRIRDVAVDLRRDAPTFGRHVAVDIGEGDGRQFWIPAGFAHGFLTLEPNTVVNYKVAAFHDPDFEAGIRWNDPALEIDWGIGLRSKPVVLSGRDQVLPLLAVVLETLLAGWNTS